jgi:molybdate transport system substrate-binding protein
MPIVIAASRRYSNRKKQERIEMNVRNPVMLFLTVFVGVVLAVPGVAFAQAGGGRISLADAKPGDVRMFVSGAMRAPIEAVRDQLEKAAGHPIVMQSSESKILQQSMEAGQPFEVALITREVTDDMIARGKIVAGSGGEIATVRLGIAVRGDAPKIDISTAGGLNKAILGATYVSRFYGLGASVPMADNLFSKLDVTDALNGRIVAMGGGEGVAGLAPAPRPPLAPGQYEMVLNLASEVIPMKGWTYLGTAPEQFQVPILLVASIGSAGDAGAARAVIAFLKSPAFDPVLKTYALTRK